MAQAEKMQHHVSTTDRCNEKMQEFYDQTHSIIKNLLKYDVLTPMWELIKIPSIKYCNREMMTSI